MTYVWARTVKTVKAPYLLQILHLGESGNQTKTPADAGATQEPQNITYIYLYTESNRLSRVKKW